MCDQHQSAIIKSSGGTRTESKPMTVYTITVNGTTHTMKSKVADYAFATGQIAADGTVHKPGFTRSKATALKTVAEIAAMGVTPYCVDLKTGVQLG